MALGRLTFELTLLVSQILDDILIDFRPLFGNDIKEFILYVALYDNLVVTGYRRAASEFRAEELGSHFEIDFCKRVLNCQLA